MPLTIPDDVLEELRTKAPGVLVEIACRLYNADRITKPEAARLTGLTRAEFENELTKRDLPWIRLNYDETYKEEFDRIREEQAAAKVKKGG